MLTNKITGFSADLLNTVRGILGEAKKCPADCECEKCEAEEMKEGSMPTADEPSAADKKTADKVRALLAKEKKPVKEESDMPFEKPYRKTGERKDEYGNKVKNVAKYLAKKAMNKQKNEEVEQVDEISSDMAYSYLRGKRERDYDISADGKSSSLKKPQSFSKMNKDMKSTARALRTIEKAKKANEEAEHNNCGTPECCGQCDTPGQIDELSVKKLDQYRTRARQDIIDADDNDDNRMADKRAGGYLDASRKIYKKLAKEEVEELDEVSKATLGRYINKAKDSIDTASYRQGNREALGGSSRPLERKLTKRHKGIETAVKKLTKEEAEQIDELSKTTLGSYVKKATNQAFSKGFTGGSMMVRGDMNRDSEEEKAGEKNVHKAIKRVSGVTKATNKLTQEEQDFIDSLNNEIFEKSDPYDIAGMIKKAKAKNDPNHPAMKHVAAIEDIKKHGGALSVQGDHVRSLIKALGEEVEQIDEISKGTAMKALQHVSSDPDDERSYTLQKKIGKKWPGMKDHAADASYTAVYGRSGRNIFQDRDKLADRAKTSYRMTKDGKANKQDLKARFRKEEVELDEALTRVTSGNKGYGYHGTVEARDEAERDKRYSAMHRYAKQLVSAAGHLQDAKKPNVMVKHFLDSPHGRHIADNPTVKNITSRFAGFKKIYDPSMHEEVELDEARGRPKKGVAKDFTIHPRTKEKLMHNNPADMARIERLQKNKVLAKPKVEADEHIMNQLQKAKTSMLGGSKINFTHGDSKQVSGTHATKILSKYAGMKPNEKEDFQKFVGHSHENLMKHV